MMLLVSVLSFFFIFFVVLSAMNIIKLQKGEVQAKVRDRLRAGDLTLTPVRLEKKERLSDMPFFDRLLRRVIHLRVLENLLSQAGYKTSLGTFLLFSFVLAAIAFFACTLLKASFFWAMMIAGGVAATPFLFAMMQKGKRFKRFSNHFADAIGLMTSSLRAGHSLQMAAETVAKEGKDLVATEFSIILSEMEMGHSFEDALKGILLRIDTPDLRLFISAVILQRETGGNLAELLDNLENLIRERQELRRELIAATAQARFSGLVLSLLPICVATFVFFISPKYMLFFVNDPLGNKMMMMCIMGQLTGMAAIQKIVEIEL